MIPTAQQVNVLAFSSYYPFHVLKAKQGSYDYHLSSAVIICSAASALIEPLRNFVTRLAKNFIDQPSG